VNDLKEKVNSCIIYSKKLSLIRGALLSSARSKIYNKFDAEDLVQDTLAILQKKRDTFKADGNFYSWAFSILHWQIKGFLSKSKRNREDCSEISDDSYACSLNKVAQKAPFDRLLRDELLTEQMQIINEIKNKIMPKREKEFFGYQLKGWSQKDIVYAMKLTNDSQFYVWKRRVIQRLKNNINITIDE
tara:strand:+ start:1049 stop:1612 length:564 start_codon:yes stop_codon:yes gene_type:complete